MEAEGKVLSFQEKTAMVEIIRKSACSGNCGDCSGCEERAMRVSVYSEFLLKTGDLVLIQSNQSSVLLGLFVVFVLPMVLPLIVYFLTAGTGIGGFFAAGSVVVAIVLIWLLSKSKWYLKKSQPCVVRVISEMRE